MSDNGEERYGGPEGLEPDPLAEQLAPDGAVMLVGILGTGPTDEDWYLYLNRELTRRAEFKASDVLRSEKIREEDPPFLGAQCTRVYLRRGARVVYTTTRSREVQAEFLRGPLGAGVTAEAATPGLPGAEDIPLMAPTFVGAGCRSVFEPCIPPSFRAWACGSEVDACPTWICPPQSRFWPCNSDLIRCNPESWFGRCDSGIVACSRFCDSRIDACESALGCSALTCPR